jgi:hypothetical protein
LIFPEVVHPCMAFSRKKLLSIYLDSSYSIPHGALLILESVFRTIDIHGPRKKKHIRRCTPEQSGYTPQSGNSQVNHGSIDKLDHADKILATNVSGICQHEGFSVKKLLFHISENYIMKTVDIALIYLEAFSGRRSRPTNTSGNRAFSTGP